MEISDLLAQVIIKYAEKVAQSASFDRTSIGIVKAADGNQYTVSAFGGTYTTKSHHKFTMNQRVAVTAPQNNFNQLILHEI